MLAEAGIRVGVGVAPVLPGITDAEHDLRAVVQAAADAGACFVWHGVLNLGEVTRDAFFGYLAGEQPHLVAMYRAMYRARYAPAPYARAVADRFTAARAGIRLRRPGIVPEPPRELALF